MEAEQWGTLRLIHMDARDAFNKIQGEDLSHIFWDELGQESTHRWC